MVYRVAAGSGFRVGALLSLRVADFRLDDDPPCIVLQAAAKRRTEDRQPIRADLADLLRPWLGGVSEGEPVFGAIPDRTADMIRVDLRRARAAWIREAMGCVARRERLSVDFLAMVDSAGRYCDFHALRVSFITAMLRGGPSVKVAQTLAQHSTPVLTMNTYNRLGIHDVASGLVCLSPSNGNSTLIREVVQLHPTGSSGPLDIVAARLPSSLPDSSAQPAPTIPVGSVALKMTGRETSREMPNKHRGGNGIGGTELNWARRDLNPHDLTAKGF